MSLRRLKIWHIAEAYPPTYGGGAAIYVQDVCRLLAERGHEVRVLSLEGTDQAPYTTRTEYDGAVRVDRLNLPYFRRDDPGGWFLGLRGWIRHRRRLSPVLNYLLSQWEPDLVQSHTPHPVDEDFLILVQRRGLPVVGMAHCGWAVCPRLNLLHSPTSTACRGPSTAKCLACLYSNYDGSWAKALLKLPWRVAKLGVFPAYRLWRRWLARRGLKGMITGSKYMHEVHRKFIPARVTHIPLGINLAGLPRARPYQPRSPVRFGFLAGFQAHKGIWDLLDVAASLKRKGLEFSLHIWGPHQESKEGELSRRGLDGTVVLRGLFTPSERWEVLAEIDVLVMATTVCEAYGRVVQEASAMGIPAVAPDSGGITEQIRDGVDGLLYRFRDPEDLERQMTRVIQDRALAPRLAGHLLPVVDTRDAVAELEQFYYETIRAGRGETAAVEAGNGSR